MAGPCSTLVSWSYSLRSVSDNTKHAAVYFQSNICFMLLDLGVDPNHVTNHSRE